MGWWGHGIFDGDTPYDCLGFLNDEINIIELAKKSNLNFNIEDDYFELLHRKEAFSDDQVAFIKSILKNNIDKIYNVYLKFSDEKSVYGTVLGGICLMYQVPVNKEIIKEFISSCDQEIEYSHSFVNKDERVKHLNYLKSALEDFDKNKTYDFEKVGLFEQFSKHLG